MIAFYLNNRYNPCNLKQSTLEGTDMTGTISVAMPRKKQSDDGGKKGPDKAHRFPSRAKTKYAGIPKAYWDALELLAKEDEKYDERSVAWLVTRAVRKFLEEHGRLPKGPEQSSD